MFITGAALCVLSLFMLVFILKQTDSYADSVTGTVTASSLNVRDKASTQGKVITSIPKQTKVSILSTVKDSNGDNWYKITVTVNSKKITGYVFASYIQKQATTSSSTSSSSSSGTVSTGSFIRRTGYVNATSLNVRKTASTAATKIASLCQNSVVSVLGETTANGYHWYKVSSEINKKTITGYVVSRYVTLHPTTTDNTIYLLATVNASDTPLYLTANVYDRKRAKLSAKQKVIRRGKLTVNGVSFTKVTAIVNGKGMNGYVKTNAITNVTATVGETVKQRAKTTVATKAKKIATTMAANVASLTKGQDVTVRGTITALGLKWYRVDFKNNGTTTTGYIRSTQVEISDDAVFEEELSAFPSSYHSSLRKLHEKYPNWHFSAVKTGLDWKTVIDNENKVGRNVIQSNVPNGGSVSSYSAPFSYLSTLPGAYNWATDKYTLCDGSNWYTVSREVLEHYMDPRNFLTEEQIFQFESLAYDSRQKKAVVSSILSGTYMSGSYNVTDNSTGKKVSGLYADAFMDAGKVSGASPYFLATRAKQETGINGSGSVSGTYPGYPGIYNFYNIGASDSSTGAAISNGLKWASTGTTYNRPWTTPYKSIVGGAEYIASSYINKGQNTNYFQKFNVVYSPFYNHQYMTNVKAPYSEARLSYNAFRDMNILKDTFVFYIPVYENMPSKPCSLPASSGNPNSYLKKITVKNGSKSLALTPTFSYDETNYTMVVDNSVSSVTVSGEPVSKRGRVTETKTYSLAAGKTTTIQVRGTAENGNSTFYTLKIARLK